MNAQLRPTNDHPRLGELEALPAFTAEAIQFAEDAEAQAIAAAVLANDGAAVIAAIEACRSRYAQFRIDEAMAKHRGEDRAIEELHRAYAGTVNWLGHDLRGRA